MTVLSKPAHPAQTMARVLALLSPYYDKDTPQAVREMEADDWAEALGQFPFWAIERACRWWKSDANGDRRKRPLEGDIVGRCKFEMRAVRAAKVHLDAPIANRQAEDRAPLSEEDKAKMRARMADLGGSVLASLRAKAGET